MSTRSCIPYGFISLHSKSVLHLLVDRGLFHEPFAFQADEESQLAFTE
jgi:hypothetical protein